MKHTYKNPIENINGGIDCLILLGDEWVPTTQDPAIEYELHEDSDWQDIKPCPQEEKDAHEELLRKQSVIDNISALEATITPRRLREALMGDSSFIEDVEAQVAELRKGL